jgi:protoheme IX farnesyltransferase
LVIFDPCTKAVFQGQINPMTRQESGSYLSVILELSKVKITVAVAFTTITGYILAARQYDPGFLMPTLGIFFLACGSSVINHLQERHTDAMMARTMQRPLPSHRISGKSAVLVAASETLAGSLILFFGSGITALILGLVAMIWYNVIYTNLKRITPHAVIPGSVIGSIPPLVGWVAAGGQLFSMPACIMALFFFVWQVPHFYLLAIKYGHQYIEAGLPSITERWSESRTKKHIFLWIILTSVTAVFVAFSSLPASVISAALIVISSIILVISFRKLISGADGTFRPFPYFMRINYYVLAITIILITGPLFYTLFHI